MYVTRAFFIKFYRYFSPREYLFCAVFRLIGFITFNRVEKKKLKLNRDIHAFRAIGRFPDIDETGNFIHGLLIRWSFGVTAFRKIVSLV